MLCIPLDNIGLAHVKLNMNFFNYIISLAVIICRKNTK
jgi:hypothetical protein